MVKKFSIFLFLFFSLNVLAQDIESMKSIARFSSDTELTSYINKAKSNGFSLTEVEGLINAQGATADEIQKLRSLWNSGNAVRS